MTLRRASGDKPLSSVVIPNDHRFVYVGPAGSRTALHADVFFSFSWSANVCGSKRWWLLPAADRRLVSDAATQPLARDILTLPAAAARAIEVEQGAGELLFVPSGWYHQVRGRGGQG